jgi:hypothetical protein
VEELKSTGEIFSTRHRAHRRYLISGRRSPETGFWEFSRVSVVKCVVNAALIGQRGFHMSGEVELLRVEGPGSGELCCLYPFRLRQRLAISSKATEACLLHSLVMPSAMKEAQTIRTTKSPSTIFQTI